MAKKKIYIFIAILLLQFSATAQYIISGVVKDSLNKPIEGATILLCKLNQEQIYKFAIAGKTGEFTISVNLKIDSFTLKVNALGYEKFQKKISNLSHNQTIILFSGATLLPSVIIKSQPVNIRGDTTNYTISHFSNKADLVIGDVLAKIPGIEIDGNGRISYNGKPISNYYIDGMDLLGSQYNIANTSIPKDIVEQVQILNKHQSIRILDSVNTSTNVALNLKLKNKAKNRYIGKIKLGAGVLPLLWDNSLTVLNFRKRNQTLAAYKNNNTGETLSLELSENISIQKAGESGPEDDKENLLNTLSMSTPKIATNRYLNNVSHLGHINVLNTLKNTAALRLNISFFKDKIERVSEINTTYYYPTETFTLVEKNNIIKHEKLISGSVNYLLNKSNIYVSNNFKSMIDLADDDVITFNNSAVKQVLKNPFYKYSNYFIVKKNWKKLIYSFNSGTIFSKMPQQLDIYPGQFTKALNQNQPFYKLNQEVSISKLSSDNFFSVFQKLKNVYQETKVGFIYTSRHLNSGIEKTTTQTQPLLVDSLSNDLYGRTAKLYFVSNTVIKKGRKQVEITLPIEKYFAIINNNTTGVAKPYEYFFFNPDVNLLLPLNSKWDFQLGFSNKKTIGTITQTYHGYIINNYRTLSRNDSILPELKTNSVNTSLSYKNPIKGLFFFTNATFNFNNKNILYTQQLADGLINNIAILKPNRQTNILVFTYLNKYFIKERTNISINYNFNWQEGQQILQNQLLKISSLGNEWKLIVKYSKLSWLSIDNTFIYTKFKNKLKSNLPAYAPILTSMFQEKLRASFFIKDNFFTFLNAEVYQNSGTGTITRSYFFGDAGINYKFKRLAVEATLNNIGNTKSYETIQLNANYRQNAQYNLRHRSLLIRCYFSL
jgi:hypothetical protein